MEWYQKRVCEWEYALKAVSGKEIDRFHVEELVGDTLFMVLGKAECYFNHYLIGKDLDEYGDLDYVGARTAFGWIITKKGIEDMKCRAEKDAEKMARQKGEFTECVFI